MLASVEGREGGKVNREGNDKRQKNQRGILKPRETGELRKRAILADAGGGGQFDELRIAIDRPDRSD
jgi:hypothetical protein